MFTSISFFTANEEDLKHNKQRYVFKKLRYSDAVQKILDKENAEPNETEKETVRYSSIRLTICYRSIQNKILLNKFDLTSVASTF